MNNLFKNILGQQALQGISAQSAYAQQAQGTRGTTAPSMSQGLTTSWNQALSNQISGLQNGYYILQQQGLWVFNGKTCSLGEFAELVYGDRPERTMFIMKYSDKPKGELK